LGFYDRHILPRITHLVCSSRAHMRQRQKIVPLARGEVLEIGAGSGLNLTLYDPSKVQTLWGLEPSSEMRALHDPGDQLRFQWLAAGAEEIPLPGDCVDTAVVTYSLCTIPEIQTALGEIRRVLRPQGRLLFCEHGAAPEQWVRRWQDRLNPVWQWFAGGCHLNRPILELIQDSGFQLTREETMYLPGWKPLTFNCWGEAKPR